jgi:hypothetical protein
MDVHHRRRDPDARDRGVQHPLELAGEVTDVGRRPPHVEADDPPLPADLADPRRPDDAPRRP